MENISIENKSLAAYVKERIDNLVEVYLTQTSIKEWKPLTPDMVRSEARKAADMWLAQKDYEATDEDFSVLEEYFKDDALSFVNHYEVITYTNAYYDDINTVDSFFTYEEAKEFYESLEDDNKALVKVDKDGLSIDGAEENEYQCIY